MNDGAKREDLVRATDQMIIEHCPASTEKNDESNKSHGSKTTAENEFNKIIFNEHDADYPTGTKLGLICLALCLSKFLIALDSIIIATAIPKITDEFGSLADVGWYGSAYLLTMTAFQLLIGKLYTFFSIKWLYLGAIGVFELGSLVCGIAPSSTALVVGRAIAGLGSAGISAGTLVILAYSVPLQKRPMYSGFIGAMYGIASGAGPVLGGIFTDKFTWRFCFYVNIPVGAFTIAVIVMFFKAPTRTQLVTLTWKQRAGQVDLIGTVFFMPAIVCLLLALQWGGSKYEWNNARIIVMFVLFGVLISIFIAVQFKIGDRATVPIRIIKQRSIWAGCFFTFCLNAGFFIMIYYIPIWLQAVQGSTAVESGMKSLPLLLGVALSTIIGGIVVTFLGYYTPWMIASTVLMSVGFGLISTFKVDSPPSKWVSYQAIAGIGVGIGLQQPLMAVQTVLDISDVPVGTSVVIFFQNLSSALFVSVGQNVFTNRLIERLAEYVPNLNSSIVLSAGATSIQSVISQEYLPGVVLAYNEALTTAYIVAASMGALSVIGSLSIEWKSVKRRTMAR